MKSPKAPAPPDPIKTAAAQTGSNIGTAISQQLVNQTDQVTPQGSLSYSQDGFTTFTDAFGKTHQIPKFTATQTYSPEQQQLYDINTQADINMATLGRDQAAKLSGYLDRPVTLDNEATEARLWELGSKRLEPQFARDEEALRTRLTNQGIREGSDAWKSAMNNFDYSRNDARNQLLLGGRGQAIQELLTERNQPLNEITALMSGSQVSQPNFTSTPQASVAGTDYAGMVRDNYNAQMQQYQAKMASRNAMLGGLFGLAGAGVKAAAGMPPGTF